ncbi:MAG: glycosyl hydrolase family 65 protein [Bacteroidota bacterium]
MAGTWLAIVKGFGGQRVLNDKLSFNTSIPAKWDELAFKIKFRKNLLEVIINQNETKIINRDGPSIELYLNGQLITAEESKSILALN